MGRSMGSIRNDGIELVHIKDTRARRDAVGGFLGGSGAQAMTKKEKAATKRCKCWMTFKVRGSPKTRWTCTKTGPHKTHKTNIVMGIGMFGYSWRSR